MISPKKAPKRATIKNICLASVYISPKSRFKKETIAHIIESIQLIRSFYDNDVRFCVSGDFNKCLIEDLLDSLGSLQNIQVKATRKGEILDLIITDMHTSYLPSLTLPALDVDEDKKGVASDHKILIFPPSNAKNCVIKREKQVIKIRPIPKKTIQICGQYIADYSWNNVFGCENADVKVNNFHEFLISTLDH